MRTRKQSRNFGQDITNYESIKEATHSFSHISRKPDRTPSSIMTVKTHRLLKKNSKKLVEDDVLNDRVDQIMVFGYKYFQNVLGESKYICIHAGDCQCANGRICDHMIGSESHNAMFPTSPQLTLSMRNILVEWLIEVHSKMDLRYETLYMTILLVDKFCSRRAVIKSQYQLLAMACLFIAGKYEEIATPKLKRIMSLCDRLYEAHDVLKMESQVLIQFSFKISQPSLNWFIGAQFYCICFNAQLEQISDNFVKVLQKFKKTCFYLTQLCLFQIGVLKKFPPQVISNSIIYTTSLRSEFMQVNIKNSTKYLSPIDLKQIRECSPLIRSIYCDRFNKKYDSVNRKYPEILNQEDQF